MCCALQHTLVVTYLQADVVWGGYGSVIVLTQSRCKFHWIAIYSILCPQDMYIDSVIIYIAAISFNLGEQLFAQGTMSDNEKQCMDTGQKGAK